MALVTLKAFDNLPEAHLLRSKLESEGITCYLFDEYLITLNPLYNLTIGGIRLNVNQEDQVRAQTILLQSAEAKSTNEKGDVITCPNCNSEELYSRYNSMKSKRALLAFLLALIFMVLPLYLKTVYKCKVCDYEFNPAS